MLEDNPKEFFMQEEIYTSSFRAGNKNVLHVLARVDG